MRPLAAHALEEAHTMLTELAIETRSPVLDGKPFGGSGAYEKLAGTMRFAVDPDDERNARVTDIGLAARNAGGQVEFTADFYLLKPVDMRKGNGRLLVDCVNRGRKVVLGMLNSAPRVPDPATEAEFGNGFLMRHGYTVAWVGWQIDVPRRDGLMALDAPRAQGVVGELRCEMRPNKRVQSLPLADRYHIPNPTVDLDDPKARLLVKAHAGAEAVEVARNAWRFSDPGHIELTGGFSPGAMYDVIYRSANPPIVGLGFLAIRDCAAHLRWSGAGNPCAAAIERTYLFGVSQTGRFLRQMLHLGLDQDEQGRAVFDAVIPHIAGGRRGEFNLRFGQPSLNAKGAVGELPPFNGPELFARLAQREKPPRIFLTNSSAEYWRGDASLIHTDTEGAQDVEPPLFVRIYALAGTQHTPGALPPLEADPNTGDRGLQRFNVVDYAPLMRAALVNLDRWVSSETEPPASAFPRLGDGSAVPAEALAGFFGTIPGVRFPEAIVRPLRLDFGKDIERGIATYPPKAGAPYRSYVSKVDADCNESAGIRSPELAVPLATYCGWNPRHPDTGAPGDLMQMMGSTLPFPATRAARNRSGDPRASIEERHASKDAYLVRVRDAAMTMVSARHVLEEDVGAIVARASRLWDYLHS
jgi:hypothetical protein